MGRNFPQLATGATLDARNSRTLTSLVGLMCRGGAGRGQGRGRAADDGVGRTRTVHAVGIGWIRCRQVLREGRR